MKTKEEIIELFKNEFGHFPDIFKISILSIEEAKNSNKEIERPGVYIFWGNNDIIRVGRSLYNARSRSNEVIKYFDLYPDDKGIMREFQNDPASKIIYITVADDKFYWVKSYESFLELKLDPNIKTARR